MNRNDKFLIASFVIGLVAFPAAWLLPKPFNLVALFFVVVCTLVIWVGATIQRTKDFIARVKK